MHVMLKPVARVLNGQPLHLLKAVILSGFFVAVPRTAFFQEEPFTPVGREITGVIENNVNRTPPTALAALIISPGSLPAKRLYSDAWKEPSFPEHEPRSLSKNRLSFSRFDIFHIKLCIAVHADSYSTCHFDILFYSTQR